MAAERQRLFFALWPAADQARVWWREGRLLLPACGGGRRLSPESLHMTLCFLGDVDAAQAACLTAAVTAIEVPPFELTLDRLDYRRRSRVCWLGCGHGHAPLALYHLVSDLRRIARHCGIAVEGRSFLPHVSLIRKAERGPAPSELPSHTWRPNGFTLARSRLSASGADYEIVNYWSFMQVKG